MEKLTMTLLRATRVLFAGLGALLMAIVFSEFVTYPTTGFKIDITTMPVEAQAILNETIGTPRTAEQWKRVEEVLHQQGWTDKRDLFFRGPLSSWYWYLVFPIIICIVLRRRWKTLTSSEFLLLCGPCAIFLIVCMVSVSL
jgi:hypothetical protein